MFSAPAGAASKRTCRSGETVFVKDGVRVFEAGREDDAWYACGPRTVKPWRLWSVQPAYGRFEVIAKIGDKVVFEGDGWGEGGGERTFLGWFDAGTSEVRRGELAGGVSNQPYEVALAADGSLGVLVGSEDGELALRVGYLGMTRARGRLRDELVLATPGARVPGTLAFEDGDRSLGWALQDGSARRVPVTAEAVTCTSGTTLVEGGGARVFEVFPNQRTSRGFQADVLAACARGETVPRRLAVADVHEQRHWAVSLARAGDRTAFQAGGVGVGVLDAATGAVGFTRPHEVTSVEDVAVADTGEVVFTGTASGSGATSRFVGRLTTGGWERLATLGGADTVDGSFTVAGGRVRWQVKDGLPQSVPLAGETAIDCASGTALLDRDGLRVFEVLPAASDDARLLACFGGAPVELLRAPRDGSWVVTELTREHGRVALHVAADAHLDWDHVLSVDAAGHVRLARSDNDSLWAPSLRDATIADDGRVAIAVKGSRRWWIVAFPRGRQRVVARPRDGVRVGSLAFSADGARVTWSDRRGRPHHART
ncbi:hypothetical protein C8N24_6426 [Solirubrobacter pauli]|uniref:Uncharacterized protein n=1 Tax=Solirubrobacter pauli TaxID=166793 RepID=A0A660KXP0_9ACTN|nr:hypothetical protein C8N24_6426 [Solirubrobacter pauli]